MTAHYLEHMSRVDDASDFVTHAEDDDCLQGERFNDEAHYRSAFEDAAIAMSIATLDWRLIRVNEAHCRLLGHTEHELLTSDFRTRIHPDDLETNADLRRDLFAGVIDSYQTERRYFHKDGHIVWCIVTVRLVRDRDGRPLYFVGQMQDITRRKRVEEELRLSQARMARVLASSSDGIVIFDRNGILSTVNPAAERLGGVRQGDLLGRRYDDLPWKVDVDDESRKILRAFEDGEAVTDTDVRIIRPDGSVVECVVDATPLLDDDQQPDGVVVIIRDVTDLRRMQEQLKQLAMHDVLTGLPNRRLFEDRAKHALISARRSGARVGVLFIDLDDFKPVNDRYGHIVGDRVLAEIASRLSKCVRAGDTIARIGGDEFAVLLHEVVTDEAIPEVERRIRAVMDAPMQIDGHEIRVTASVGSSLTSGGEQHLDALLKQADTAMYSAKRSREHTQRVTSSPTANYWTAYRAV